MTSQPIHETLIPEDKPERFELTWSIIECLDMAFVFTSGNKIIVRTAPTKLYHHDDLAIALEIILQCKTFSPGLFEKRSMRWVRAGETVTISGEHG